MDLAKFTSMIASRSLYFACPNQLSDPFEGWKSRSELRVWERFRESRIQDFKNATNRMRDYKPNIPENAFDSIIAQAECQLNIQSMIREASERFGINCWHINKYESDAMWKLYGAAGSGVAVVSTKARLQKALAGTENLKIESVRYIDFDKDPIVKDRKDYGLFQKRRAFAHERELRATILLAKYGVGASIPCRLETLIRKIYISPLAPAVYVEAVNYVVEQSDMRSKPKVEVSKLLSPPDY